MMHSKRWEVLQIRHAKDTEFFILQDCYKAEIFSIFGICQ